MALPKYNQYAWLIDTIRSAGRINKREIDKLWAKSPLNEKKERTYPLRSFHRHKEAILEQFGLIIACEKGNGWNYYISNVDEIRSEGIRSHLLNSLSFTNQLVDLVDLQKRIFFEPVQDGSLHLATLLGAMRDKRAVILSFLPSLGLMPVEVFPYCLKEKNHKWYLAAKNTAALDSETQVFELVNVLSVIRSKNKGSMPRWFDGEMFFNSYFGHQKPVVEKPVKRAPKPKEEKPVVEKKPKAEKKVQQAPASAAEQLSLF